MLILFLVNYFVFSFFFCNFDLTRPDCLAGQTLPAWRVCDKLFSRWSWQRSRLKRALFTTNTDKKWQNHWPFSAKVKKSSHRFSSFNQRLFWSVDRVDLNRIHKGSSLKVTRKIIVSLWREKKAKKAIVGRVWLKAFSSSDMRPAVSVNNIND